MGGFLLQVTRRGGDRADSPLVRTTSYLGTTDTEKALGHEANVTGVLNWSEGRQTPERLAELMSTGQVVDGSYLLVCVHPASIRIWSDPLGTVPGYYGFSDDSIVVGTNALGVANSLDKGVDESACGLYALFDYVPQPRTRFLHVFRCAPDRVVEVNVETGRVKTEKYFDLSQAVAEKATALKATGQAPDVLIHEAWLSSLSKCLGSVHPSSRIGVSLSGGLDSRYLMCAARELGYNCSCYTYSSSPSASDAVLARRNAECARLLWRYLPVAYRSSEMASFVAKYGSMEPPSMSFLPKVAEHLRGEMDIVLVAAGGDVIWGSHASLKQVARTLGAYSTWRKQCSSRSAAWVAASEIGDVSWALSLPAWQATLLDAS